MNYEIKKMSKVLSRIGKHQYISDSLWKEKNQASVTLNGARIINIKEPLKKGSFMDKALSNLKAKSTQEFGQMGRKSKYLNCVEGYLALFYPVAFAKMEI